MADKRSKLVLIGPDGGQKELNFGHTRVPLNSNPGTPTTEKPSLDAENAFNEGLFNQKPIVADKVAPVKFPRKPLKSIGGNPYIPARLYPIDHNMQDTWYIVFYAWDLGQERLRRKRVGKSELNLPISKKERLAIAQKLIDEINYWLERDYTIDSEKAPADDRRIPTIQVEEFRGYTLSEAIDYVANRKVKVEGIALRSSEQYMATKSTLEDFLKHEKLPAAFKLRHVSYEFFNRYFEYLKTVRGVANKTYNNHRTALHAVFECLLKQNRSLLHGVNPIKDFKMLKTKSRKHAAFTDQHLTMIMDHINETGNAQLLLFIRFIFYTLARPKRELRLLKVGDIRMDHRRILFRADNAKTDIEQFVGIGESLALIIERSGILSYPATWYVFSVKGTPGEVPTGKNYFYKQFKEVLSELKLNEVNPYYSMYSLKHTGAISLYMATKDIKLLQQQCRHENLEQTNNYLRDLGLFQDFEQLNKWKGPI